MFFIQFPILIRILDLISVPKHSRDSLILIKFNTFSTWREIVSVHSSQWCNSLNWIQLNDADDFLQFPIVILNLDLISVPNHSKGSYILKKFNTFSSWREIVSVHSSQWCNSLNWIQLNDADDFLQFPILIRILDLISVPNHSKDSFILIIFTLSPHGGRLLVSIRVSGVIHLIGYTLMMQMFFIHFPILIRILDLISVPNHSRDSFILIKFNTFSSWRGLLLSIHISGVIHLIGYSLMMQMVFFNFRF